MRRWVVDQFGPAERRPVVLLDPEGIVDDEEARQATSAGAVVYASDWFDLRRGWERHGRHRDQAQHVVFVVRDPAVTSDRDLPYDIASTSSVRRVRLPVTGDLRGALTAMQDTASDAAVKAIVDRRVEPADALLTAAAGDLPDNIVDGPAEFAVALRLTLRPQPAPILGLARRRLRDELAIAVVADDPRLQVVASAWAAWLSEGERSQWTAHIERARSELTDLFLAGRLPQAEHAGSDVPAWAQVGVAQPSLESRVEALLADPPTPAADLESWTRIAQWWGEVRSALAGINPPAEDLDERAWDWWQRTDREFLKWLRDSYGSELSRSWASWPRSVDKVQLFLAKRRVASGRILLVVLDGMGFTQWTRLRELVHPAVYEAGGVLAMIPTLTEVSRQAIAAANFPIDFYDSIRTTSKEPQRWAAAWKAAGATAAWVRVDGTAKSELDAIPFGRVDAIGVVVSATDELMHSSDMLGDVGLHLALEGWSRSGVLQSLLAEAAGHGYETWLTADHGNLAVARTKNPREGDFVERNGTRARRYGSKSLRDASSVGGIAWDDLPGYPPGEAERLLFAPGRTGWGTARLSHGGLSLDEVIVPLVRVEPGA